MSFIDPKLLFLVQIAIDLTIIVFFIFLIRRLKVSHKGKALDRGLKIYESLLEDADKTAGEFKEQLEKKHHVMKRLNEELDKRIIGLNALLNRADVLLSSQRKQDGYADPIPAPPSRQQREIIKLAKKGYNLEEIAKTLSMPKGEVKLLLDLKKKLARMGDREGMS